MADKLTGRLVWDPELRFTASGTPLCTFVVGDDSTGTKCNAWGDLGKAIAEGYDRYHMGVMVTVRGNYKTREFGGNQVTELSVLSIEVT